MRKMAGWWLMLSVVAFPLCSPSVKAGPAVAPPATHTAPHFDYEGAAGPEHWGDLSPDYVLCKSGKEQSPIDIASAVPASLRPIRFSYAGTSLNLVNNGHTIQQNYDAGSSITLDGVVYKLVQFHFHIPSETKINGKTANMELHFVHKNDAGRLAVVAVLMNKGRANPVIQRLFDHAPATEGHRAARLNIDANSLLPAERSYYSFPGSLTTPPCSEGVSWNVLKAGIEVSEPQIQAFKKFFRINARPVQPLNGRIVKTS